MSNALLIDLVKEKINELSKEHLVIVLLKKNANIFGEKSAKEKYEKMTEEQLRDEVIKSFERGYDVFDSTFVCMLPSYLEVAKQPNLAIQELVDELMQTFEFCNEQYEDDKRRQQTIEILTNESFKSEVKDVISELLINEYNYDYGTELDEKVEVVFLHLVFELLYVTTSDLDLAALMEYWGKENE